MIDYEERLGLESYYKSLNISSKYWESIIQAPSSIRTELLEYIENIEMLQWMVGSDEERGYAKDKPKDDKGRIIVDITKPHILEDMDFFRERAIYFQKHGKYTNLYPNPHPKSEYRKFWDEETRRCKEGYVRESDGEWISGYYYWYLNYSPIMQTVSIDGGTRAERVLDFPLIWDSDYLFYHYVEQGEENSEYGTILKSRGKGYSFKVSSMLTRNFYLYKKSKSFAFASESEYLTKDGILNKAWDQLSFVDENTPWRKLRQKKDTTGHKRASYIDSEGKEKGYFSEIIEVTTKANPEKGRGKRGKLLIHEEAGIYPKLLETWNIARPSIEDGDFTFGYQICFGTGGTPGSKFEGLEELFYNGGGYKVKVVRNVWDKIRGEGTCGYFIPEYMNRKACYDKDGNSDVIKALKEILIGRKKVRENASKQNALTQEKAERPITPAEAVIRIEGSLFPVDDLKSYLESITPDIMKFTSQHYIGKLIINPDTNKIDYSPSADVKVIREFPLKDNVNKEGAIEIFELPQTSGDGTIPRFRYFAGCLTPGEKVLTDSGMREVEKVSLKDKLINKEGKKVSIQNLQKYYVEEEDTYNIKVSNTFRATNFTKEHPIYVSKEKIKYPGLKRRQGGEPQRIRTFDFQFKKVENVNVGEWIQVPNIYLKEDNKLDKYWKTYNTRIDFQIPKCPLYDKDFWWLIGYLLGDGWVNEKSSSITFAVSKQELYYIDKIKEIVEKLFSRKCYVRDRNTGAIEVSFSCKQLAKFILGHFGKYAIGKRIPEWTKYINKDLKKYLVLGYLDSDGCISNKNKYTYASFVSINLELLESIQDILFSLGVVSSLKKLRDARTMIIRGKTSKTKETYELNMASNASFIFKKLFINEQNVGKINKINDDNTVLKNRVKNKCYLSDDNKFIYFQITEIEKSKYTGWVYNFECDTHTFMCHHITTHNCDTIDDDSSTTNSLASIFIMDILTDRIVAEYTGRPKTANAFYEICLRLLKFYNAIANYENDKKGLFAYFSHRNALSYLSPNPQILKDMELVKANNLFGNKAIGTNSGTKINAWGRRLQADWMLEPAYGEEKTGLLNLHKIRSVGYLKEAIGWNEDGNFDRVSAMGMLMILREEYKKYKLQISNENMGMKTKQLANDNFFDMNFTRKGQISKVEKQVLMEKSYNDLKEFTK